MEDPKAVKSLAKLDAALAGGDFYGALQVYRTIIKRKIDAGSLDEARALLASGARALLRHGKCLEALDLGDLLLKDLLAQQPLTAAGVGAVLDIAAGLPAGACTAQTAAFLRAALKWARACLEASPPPPGSLRGDAADAALASLHAAVARACAGGGPEFFPDAQRHFLEAGQPGELAALLLAWSARGYAGERDLFLARAVLQLACLGNLRDANAVRDAFVAGCPGGALDTPLAHFTRFLLLTLERDARPLFTLLCDKYAKALERDPQLPAYLATIGARFYQIQPPPSGADAMMGSLMSMLGGGGGGGGGNPFAALMGGGGGGGGRGAPDLASLMSALSGSGRR